MLNGEWVVVDAPGETLEGRVIGIDEEGALRLESPCGTTVRAIAGDVTLRKNVTRSR